MPGIITPPKSSIIGTSNNTSKNNDNDDNDHKDDDMPALQTRDTGIDGDSDSDSENESEDDQHNHTTTPHQPTFVVLIPRPILKKRKRTKNNVKLRELQRRIDTAMHKGNTVDTKIQSTEISKSVDVHVDGTSFLPFRANNPSMYTTITIENITVEVDGMSGNLNSPESTVLAETGISDNRHYAGHMGGLDDGNPDGISDGILDGSNEGIRTGPHEGPQEGTRKGSLTESHTLQNTHPRNERRNYKGQNEGTETGNRDGISEGIMDGWTARRYENR